MSFFKKLSESVSKGAKTAAEQAQIMVEITRLNAQISGKRKEIDKLFASIGEAVYEAQTTAQDDVLTKELIAPSVNEVTALRGEIDHLYERIRVLRNERVCECGHKLENDDRFCPACGRAVAPPEPRSQAAEEDGGGAISEAAAGRETDDR